MEGIGRFILVCGLVMAAVGALFIVFSKIGWFGRLPGDISIETPTVRVYIPVATSLLMSALLSLIFYLWRR